MNDAERQTLKMILGRCEHVEAVCRSSIEHDKHRETGPNDWTDRHWLAQTILNIFDGSIDEQIAEEIRAGTNP